MINFLFPILLPIEVALPGALLFALPTMLPVAFLFALLAAWPCASHNALLGTLSGALSSASGPLRTLQMPAQIIIHHLRAMPRATLFGDKGLAVVERHIILVASHKELPLCGRPRAGVLIASIGGRHGGVTRASARSVVLGAGSTSTEPAHQLGPITLIVPIIVAINERDAAEIIGKRIASIHKPKDKIAAATMAVQLHLRHSCARTTCASRICFRTT